MYKLGSIEAQLTAINAKLDAKEAAQDKQISSLEKKVTTLEQWRLLQLGAASAVSFIIGILLKVIPFG